MAPALACYLPTSPSLAEYVPLWLSGLWRSCELLAALSANAGVAFATLDYETRYRNEREAGTCWDSAGEEWRWLTLVTTCISVLCLALRDIARNIHSRSLHLPPTPIFPSSTLLEILLLLVFPYPYMTNALHYAQRYRVIGQAAYWDSEICYSWAEIAYVVMFLRLLFLVRSACRFSQYESDFSYSVSQNLGFEPGWQFSLQCYMHQYDFGTIIFLFFFQIFLFAVFVRVFERPFTALSGMGLDNFNTTLWLMSASSTTIGYGDFAPFTYMGRLLSFAVAASGQILLFGFMATARKRLELTAEEMACYRELHTKRRAGDLVGLAFKYKMCRRNRSHGLSLVYVSLIKSYIKHHRAHGIKNLGLHEEYRDKLKMQVGHLSQYLEKLNAKAEELLEN